ncbi:hypothetical protein [Paenibacillus sp. BK720]|uniref:hypothetical protein n=1 Tax=Paenibacillus sp. BK720 TaxID=2587092 RepID=UPI0014218C0F|nr:hypothetical protein [Paenibacillus sp. BK720]NIK67931.1 hypothetical protein [Paenibacillus sp. BK720]
MVLLEADELVTYLPDAANMEEGDKQVFLARANAYCLAYIGGLPPIQDWDPKQENLKGIVAQAVEIIAEGETAQIDPTNGNITEAAPARPGRPADPLHRIDKMLLPYKGAFDRLHAFNITQGFAFL